MSNTIVVIESDLSLLQRLCAEINKNGFSVISTPDSKGAVDLVKKEKPILVVLSVELSTSQSGYAICSKLKKDEETKNIPIIITGSDSKGFESHKRLLKARADEYLLKPFEPSVLIEKVSAIVGIPEIQSTDLVLEDEALGANGSMRSYAEHDQTRSGDPDLEMLDAAFESLAESKSPSNFFGNEESAKSFASLTEDTFTGDTTAIDSDSLYELGEAGNEIDPISPGDQAEEDFVLDALDAIDHSQKHVTVPTSLQVSIPATAAATITGIDPELASLREQVGLLTNRIRNLEDQLAEKTNELDAYLVTSSGKDKEFFTLREQNTKKDKEILRLKGEVNEKEHKIIDLEENQTRLEQNNSELTTELAKRDAQIKTFVQRQEAYQTEQIKLDNSLNQSKDELRQLSVRLATVQGELDHLQESNRELERKLGESREATFSTEKKLESCNSDLEQARAILEEAQDKIRVLEPEADRAVRLDEEVADLHACITNLEEQVAKNEERVVKAYQRIRFDEKRLDKMKKTLEVAMQIFDENENTDRESPWEQETGS